jgi:hypothetical protein
MRMMQSIILWFVGLTIISPTVAAVAQHADVAVVVNENNHVASITLAELRKVFVGERRSWAVGLPIKLIVRSPVSPERTALLKLVAMSESEYKQYWITQIFRGEADAEPLTLPSLDLEKQALSIFSGGIALMNAREVKPGMRVLNINGHLPGEPGYPLH